MTDTENLREYLFKETEIVQDVISRLAGNSFLIKGWAVTLVVASLLLRGTSYHHFVAFIPLIIFWYYDTYFLRLERLYRKLYDWLVENRLKNNQYLLDVSKDRLEKRFGNEVPCKLQLAFSTTLIVFYGFLFLIIIASIIIDFYTGALDLSANQTVL